MRKFIAFAFITLSVQILPATTIMQQPHALLECTGENGSVQIKQKLEKHDNFLRLKIPVSQAQKYKQIKITPDFAIARTRCC